jgi:hypothetical protein
MTSHGGMVKMKSRNVIRPLGPQQTAENVTALSETNNVYNIMETMISFTQ